MHGEHYESQECGQDSEVYTRIVGYYRPIKRWNEGKKADYKDCIEYNFFCNS
ncbi:anaerobic ribonucleoside-triphosphate reductase [Maridesulfovibrio frigidus]|uniref:anaerobic ribonucleoside-triphosphate reductase n=1 Tax=Maridesulfovibrio frigidus TaxID=340956 RepID=UPI001F1E9ABE|nr:anaerobic ribonucleoside-triphosphate reductase [Maridesulfovibrio frigidus]